MICHLLAHKQTMLFPRFIFLTITPHNTSPHLDVPQRIQLPQEQQGARHIMSRILVWFFSSFLLLIITLDSLQMNLHCSVMSVHSTTTTPLLKGFIQYRYQDATSPAHYQHMTTWRQGLEMHLCLELLVHFFSSFCSSYSCLYRLLIYTLR